MPRYFFDLRWPDRTHKDESGTLLSDDAAARTLADRVVRELKQGGGYDDPELTMVVRGHDGDTVHSIPF